MKIIVLVEGELIDRQDDVEIFIDAEPEDTCDDIIIKCSLAVSGLDTEKVELFYENRKYEKSVKFFKIQYQVNTRVYLRASGKACGCTIF